MVDLSTMNDSDLLDRYDDISESLYWAAHMAAVSDVDGPAVSSVLRPILVELNQVNQILRARSSGHIVSTNKFK